MAEMCKVDTINRLEGRKKKKIKLSILDSRHIGAGIKKKYIKFSYWLSEMLRMLKDWLGIGQKESRPCLGSFADQPRSGRSEWLVRSLHRQPGSIPESGRRSAIRCQCWKPSSAGRDGPRRTSCPADKEPGIRSMVWKRQETRTGAPK